MGDSDQELLRRFAQDSDESAFEALLQRHVDLVHSAALRQAGPDPQAAQDIAQSVFIDLARKAPQLHGHTTLTGWLYTAVRHAATAHRRTEARRTQREQTAVSMNLADSIPGQEPDWNRLRPLLDEAMHALSDDDREAVLLRCFERRAYSEIGMRLGVAENAARMRVERALDRLGGLLARRGITSTAAGLALVLETHAVTATPTAITEGIARGARGAVRPSGGPNVISMPLRPGWSWAVAMLLLVGIAGLIWTNRRADRSHPSSATAESNTQASGSLGPPDAGSSNSAAEGVQIGGASSADTIDGSVGRLSLTAHLQTAALANYTAKGNVTVQVYFYDKEGNLLDQSPYPDVPLMTSCDFVYFRKGKQWRLNIVHPDPAFERNTVWRSVMPFSETNLIDMISFPERVHVTGNAAVTIVTTRFLPADIANTHFAWMILNYWEIKGMLGPQLECHDFWKQGTSPNSDAKTHRIIESDSGWTYWNSGKYPQRDAIGNLVLENGKPLIKAYPPPFDEGFSEGEVHVQWTAVGDTLIPKKAHAMLMGLTKKNFEDGVSMIPLRKMELVVNSYDTNALDSVLFSTQWTNHLASVVDNRVTNKQGIPLSFLTKTQVMNPSEKSLRKHQYLAETIDALKQSYRTNSDPRTSRESLGY
jgi:RNA polymerase sigma factor (sigma-70 family)